MGLPTIFDSTQRSQSTLVKSVTANRFGLSTGSSTTVSWPPGFEENAMKKPLLRLDGFDDLTMRGKCCQLYNYSSAVSSKSMLSVHSFYWLFVIVLP